MHPQYRQTRNHLSPQMRWLLGEYGQCKTSEEAEALNIRRKIPKDGQRFLDILCEVKRELQYAQSLLDTAVSLRTPLVLTLGTNENEINNLRKAINVTFNCIYQYRLPAPPQETKKKRKLGRVYYEESSPCKSVIKRIEKTECYVSQWADIDCNSIKEKTARPCYDKLLKRFVNENRFNRRYHTEGGTRPCLDGNDTAADPYQRFIHILDGAIEHCRVLFMVLSTLNWIAMETNRFHMVYPDTMQLSLVNQEAIAATEFLEAYNRYFRHCTNLLKNLANYFFEGNYQACDDLLCMKPSKTGLKISPENKAILDMEIQQQHDRCEQIKKDLLFQKDCVEDMRRKVNAFAQNCKDLKDKQQDFKGDDAYAKRLDAAEQQLSNAQCTFVILEKQEESLLKKLDVEQNQLKALQSTLNNSYTYVDSQTHIREIFSRCRATSDFSCSPPPDATPARPLTSTTRSMHP